MYYCTGIIENIVFLILKESLQSIDIQYLQLLIIQHRFSIDHWSIQYWPLVDSVLTTGRIMLDYVNAVVETYLRNGNILHPFRVWRLLLRWPTNHTTAKELYLLNFREILSKKCLLPTGGSLNVRIFLRMHRVNPLLVICFRTRIHLPLCMTPRPVLMILTIQRAASSEWQNKFTHNAFDFCLNTLLRFYLSINSFVMINKLYYWKTENLFYFYYNNLGKCNIYHGNICDRKI